MIRPKTCCAYIFALWIGLCFAGCSKPAPPPTTGGLDPVDQEIITNATKKPVQQIPPGYTVNSGGEVVPNAETTTSDDSSGQP